jgi:hypothetical protein
MLFQCGEGISNEIKVVIFIRLFSVISIGLLTTAVKNTIYG